MNQYIKTYQTNPINPILAANGCKHAYMLFACSVYDCFVCACVCLCVRVRG